MISRAGAGKHSKRKTVMIEVKNLKKVYKTKKGVTVNALDGVSLRFPDTGMVFVLGKSGSGKSTLLNVIGGLDSFDSGEIIIKGKSSVDFKQRDFDSYRNTYIGFIFQEYNILEELTVGANIALAIELQGRRATNEEINSILKEVDLEGYGGRKPNELSGGQKQRVAIARALVKRPEIIMADEPTGALDSATGKQVFDTLKALSRDKLVVIVSHDREFSEKYADRIIELADGSVISDVELAGEGESVETVEEYVSDEESLSFGDAEITVAAGYMLTEEDRLLINEYLSGAKDGAVIKLSKREAKRAVKKASSFVPTDESKIPRHSGNDFKLIKSRLSLKNAFRLGSSGLKYKKFRLVFTIFLSIISFTLFGLADTIAAYDSAKTATSSIYDTGVTYASFAKQIKHYYDEGSNDYYWIDYDTYLTPSDVEKIKDETGIDVLGVYKKNINPSFASNLGEPENVKSNYELVYGSQFSGLAALNASSLRELGFTLHGALPKQGEREIVIPSFVFDYFKLMGYRDRTTGKTEEIAEYEDIIGKTFMIGVSYLDKDEYKVTGVVDIGLDYSRYLELADPNAQSSMNALTYMSMVNELDSLRNFSYATLLFVDQSMIDTLIDESSGKADTVNGHVQLLYVKDPNQEYLWDNNNVEDSIYVSGLNSLDNVKGVVWADGKEREELADNEVVVTLDMLINSLSSEYSDVLYDSNKLVGFEKELYDKTQNGNHYIYVNNLNDVIYSVKRVAAYKYATENRGAAVTHYKNWEKKYYGSLQHNSDFYNNSDEFLDEFASAFDWYGMTFTGSDSIVDDYVDSLVARYDIENLTLPKELAASLVAKIASGSDFFSSYDISSIRFKQNFRDNYREIIRRKYATENYVDARAFYLHTHKGLSNSDLKNIEISRIIDEYCNFYLVDQDSYGNEEMKELVASFKPQASVSYDTYLLKEVFRVYEEIKPESTLVLEWYSNAGGDGVSEPLEIVGVYKADLIKGMYYSSDCAVLSEKYMNAILGANRGGIYSFAIGNMPESMGGISDVVDFSYGVIDDSYRFSLMNNATEQLSMVDEILDVLGQVFLYVGIGFAVFASLMLSNFIGTSIAHKKHDIGILRAIGSRSADVFKIFFAESFIIAMINYVLSVAGTLSVTIVINNLLREDAGLLITFLNFGIRQIAVLLAVSLAVALIATFLPVKKIASMKPIDAIKNRK